MDDTGADQGVPGLVSVIIPAFNEEASVDKLHVEILDVFAGLDRDVEIIFIDDGSSDATPEHLRALCAGHQMTRLICFRRNFGKAAALDAGFNVARGEIIFTMDADLQDDPAEIPRFLEALDSGLDVVSGWKHQRNDPLDKTLPSKVFNGVVGHLSGVSLHDFNCGFKAYRSKALAGLRLYGELHRFIPVILHWQGFRIGEIAVNHRARQYGKSKYGMGRLFKGGLDFLGVMLNTRYATRPLHVFGGAAFLFGGIGFAILSYLTVLWFVGAGPIGDRPLLMLGILMVMTSFQFVTIGLLGEFIQHQGADRKRYTIRSVTNFEDGQMSPELSRKLRDAATMMKEVQSAWTQQQSGTTQPSATSQSTPTRTRSTG
ncbi:MAG: glycosyltransferase family 2 protein [Henriciella sp.]|uniref:glycosyltransferase family 2 protein n=1 Tax=Henriciella sp. TaxID=1968823 RepID=UPI0032EF0CC0